MTLPLEADPLSLAAQIGRVHPEFVQAVDHLIACPACVPLGQPLAAGAHLAACVTPDGDPDAFLDGVSQIAALAAADALAEARNQNVAVAALYLILYVLWLARAGELRWPEAWGPGCPKMGGDDAVA